MSDEHHRLFLTIVEARNLPAADKGGTSDPYIKIKDEPGLKCPSAGLKTKVIKKTLNPTWNEQFVFEFSYRLEKIQFKAFDHDTFRDDVLGKVNIPVRVFLAGPHDGWHRLMNGPRVAGELRIQSRCEFAYPIAVPGAALPLPATPSVTIALGWKAAKAGGVIDLDASVAVLGYDKRLLESCSFKRLVALGGALRHSGDDRTGEGGGDDESVKVTLAALPPAAAYISCVVCSFSGQPMLRVKSAYTRLLDAGGRTLTYWRLSDLTSTAVHMGFMYRSSATPSGWAFASRGTVMTGRTLEECLPAVAGDLQFSTGPGLAPPIGI